MRSIRDFINIISEAGTYTGLDPIIRKRSGMGPATNAEIEAFLKANPNYGWVLDRNGNRTNMMSGGEQEMLKSARAEAAKLPATPAAAPVQAAPVQAAPVAEPAPAPVQASAPATYNAAADSQAANMAMPNNGLPVAEPAPAPVVTSVAEPAPAPATYNAAADSQAANMAMPNNGLAATGSAALDGTVVGADPATTIAGGPATAAGGAGRSDSAAQPATNRDSMTFSQAFADARKNKEENFTWKGKKYAVKLAAPTTAAPTKAAPTAAPTAAAPAQLPLGFGPGKRAPIMAADYEELARQQAAAKKAAATPAAAATPPANKVPPQPTLNGKPSTGYKGQEWLKKYGATHNPDGTPKSTVSAQPNTQLDPRGKPLVKDKDGNLGYYNNPNVPSKGFTVVVPVAPAGGMYKESAGYSEDQILARIIDLARR